MPVMDAKLVGLSTIAALFLVGTLPSNILLLSLPFSGAQYAYGQQGGDFLIYVNSDYGLTIDYPHDWYKEELPGNNPVTFYSPYENDNDQYAEYVGIFTESVGSGISLNSYVDDYIDEMQDILPELEVAEQSSVSISGLSGVKVVSADTDFDQDGNLDHKSIRFFVIEDGRAFVIVYDAVQGRYETYLPIVDEMLNSLEIDTAGLPVTGDKFLTYDNSTYYGIEIDYPDNWDFEYYDEGNYHFTYFYPPFDNDLDLIPDFLGVGYEEIPRGTTLGQYTHASINAFSSGDEYFEMIEDGAATLDGFPAHKITFETFSYDFGIDIKATAIWTVHQDRAYIVLFQSARADYDTYIPQVEDMIESLDIGSDATGSGSPSPELGLETAKFLSYENRNQAFKIQYPDSWIKTEIHGGGAGLAGEVVSFASPLQDGYISIAIEELFFNPMSLDEYNEYSIASIKQQTSLFKVESSESYLISDHDGNKIVYSGLFTFFGDTLVDVKVMQAWTVVHEGRAYIMTYISIPEKFDDYLPLAQNVFDSLEINANDVPKKVEGKYINEELGLSIDLPAGWAGLGAGPELSDQLPFDNAVVILPEIGDFSESITNKSRDEIDIEAVMRQLLSSIVVIASADTDEILHGELETHNTAGGSVEDKGACETGDSAKIVKTSTSGGFKALKMEGECSYPGLDSSYHLAAYVFVNKERTIFFAFLGSDESRLEEFEGAIKTVSVEGAIDLSDPAAIAAVMGEEERQLTRHSVSVDENPYDVSVLSNSTISEVTLDHEKKQISFRVEGAEGTMGSTEIEIGKVLKGPYVVTIDGTEVGTFMIEDETTDQTILAFRYPHSAHQVTITGTTVVPEFGSIAVLTMAAGISAMILGYLTMQKRFWNTIA